MKQNIAINSQKYMIENIAKEYMEIFHKVILEHRHPKEQYFYVDDTRELC